MAPKPYRWPCSVIGCKRTIGGCRPMMEKAGDWCFCSKHWPMVPRDVKRVIRRKQRSMRQLRSAADYYRADMDYAMESLRAKQFNRSIIAYQRIMRRVISRVNARVVGL